MRIDVLGVGFDNVTMTEAVERGMSLLRSEGAHYVVTPNPEIVEICREDAAAKAAVNGADLVLPDGIGVIKGAAMLGTPLKEMAPRGARSPAAYCRVMLNLAAAAEIVCPHEPDADETIHFDGKDEFFN